MNHKDVCRTAPATPGLLITTLYVRAPARVEVSELLREVTRQSVSPAGQCRAPAPPCHSSAPLPQGRGLCPHTPPPNPTPELYCMLCCFILHSALQHTFLNCTSSTPLQPKFTLIFVIPKNQGFNIQPAEDNIDLDFTSPLFKVLLSPF